MKEKEEEKRDPRELKARLLHRPIKMKGWRRRSFKKHAGLLGLGGGGVFFVPPPGGGVVFLATQGSKSRTWKFNRQVL